MALDFHQTARRIEAMAVSLQSNREEKERRLVAALRTIEHPLDRQGSKPIDSVTLTRRIEAAGDPRRVTWLVAGPSSADSDGPRLDARFRPPERVSEYRALACDGSQIDVDRHGPAHCFLINVGGVVIRYGPQPAAELFSQPHLYSGPDETVLRDPEGGGREQAIEGALLGIKRSVMECEELEARVRGIDDSLPALALLDGSLVLWELSGQRYPEFVREALLGDGFLPAMDRLFEAGRRRILAFGSYISRPRSTEVLNILRVAHCPWDGLEEAGCDHFCGRGGPGARECDEVAQGLTDRDLFEVLLSPGERSALFASQSRIVTSQYGRHRVMFFYLHVGDEIARVETPQWAVEDPAALDLLHAGVLDQCRKGRGYPLVLQEAHERAVVTMADRRYFWGLVQTAAEGTEVSLKARSKRLRAV